MGYRPRIPPLDKQPTPPPLGPTRTSPRLKRRKPRKAVMLRRGMMSHGGLDVHGHDQTDFRPRPIARRLLAALIVAVSVSPVVASDGSHPIATAEVVRLSGDR